MALSINAKTRLREFHDTLWRYRGDDYEDFGASHSHSVFETERAFEALIGVLLEDTDAV